MEETIRCEVSECAHLLKYDPDETMISSSALAVAFDPVTTSYEERSLVRFEYPDIIKRRKITNITLHLYVAKLTWSEKPLSVSIAMVGFGKAWNWRTVTWNNQPDIGYPFNTDKQYISFSDLREGSELTLEADNGLNVADIAGNLFEDGIKLQPAVQNGLGRNQYLGFAPPSDPVNPPYLDVVTEKVPVYVTGAYPTDGFVDVKKDSTFRWAVGYAQGGSAGYILGNIPQKSAKFRWRNTGEVNYCEIEVLGENCSYTVPANTFAAESIEWQVLLQSIDEMWSEPTPWHTLTTVDNLSTAAAVSPINSYVDSKKPQAFTWQHIIDTGTTPTKSELEYRIGSGTWMPLAIVTGSNTSTVIPVDTLPGGNVYWRVRTYNSDNAAGAWSAPVAIVVQGAPPAPTISSVTNAARPTISWQSLGQVAYDLRIQSSEDTVYSAGEIAGTDKLYKVRAYLEDGAYTASVRIKNSDQLWSPWTTSAFKITTIKPTAPTVTATTITNAARIAVTGGTEKMYLLRDGVPIAKISTAYDDYAALGTHTYVVRAIGMDDSFIDTEPASVTVTVKYALLAAVDDLSNTIRLVIKRGERPKHTGSKQLGGTARHFAGRRLPMYTFSEFTDETYTSSYSFRDPADWCKLDNLIERRRTVLYRDLRGNRYYGVILSMSFEQDKISTDFDLSITRVDYVECIEYD